MPPPGPPFDLEDMHTKESLMSNPVTVTPKTLADNDRQMAQARNEVDHLVDAIVAHKEAGCHHLNCPGKETLDFFRDATSTGRHLFVALHMLADLQRATGGEFVRDLFKGAI